MQVLFCVLREADTLALLAICYSVLYFGCQTPGLSSHFLPLTVHLQRDSAFEISTGLYHLWKLATRLCKLQKAAIRCPLLPWFVWQPWALVFTTCCCFFKSGGSIKFQHCAILADGTSLSCLFRLGSYVFQSRRSPSVSALPTLTPYLVYWYAPDKNINCIMCHIHCTCTYIHTYIPTCTCVYVVNNLTPRGGRDYLSVGIKQAALKCL